MIGKLRLEVLALALAATAFVTVAVRPVHAESAASLDADATAALATLYQHTPSAKVLGDKAKAILIFPNMVKAAFLVGGEYGQGVLRRSGETVGYYNTIGGSYGLQAGAQTFGYALFLMTDEALTYLDKSDGWEIGAGPTVVIVDQGFAKNLSTTTLQKDVYAAIFDQKGLMAGISIQGTKISKIAK